MYNAAALFRIKIVFLPKLALSPWRAAAEKFVSWEIL
jgi:hypothetical protein